MKRKFDLEKTVYAVAAIAFFFLLWWFLTTFTPVKETTPGPIEVLQLLVSSFYTPIGNKVIIGHLLVSLRRVLVGFSVATIIGIVLGIAMGTSRWAEAIFKPFLSCCAPFPPLPGSRWSSCSSASAKLPSTSCAASAHSPTLPSTPIPALRT